MSALQAIRPTLLAPADWPTTAEAKAKMERQIIEVSETLAMVVERLDHVVDGQREMKAQLQAQGAVLSEYKFFRRVALGTLTVVFTSIGIVLGPAAADWVKKHLGL